MKKRITCCKNCKYSQKDWDNQTSCTAGITYHRYRYYVQNTELKDCMYYKRIWWKFWRAK